MHCRTNNHGFTLLEVMIVVAIISIGTGLAIPSIIEWLPNYRLKSASRDLFTNFNRAKMEAVKRNTNCAITFNRPGSDYIVYTESALSQNLEFDGADQILVSVTFADYRSGVGLDLTKGIGLDGIDYTDNDNNYPTVAFNSRGLPINNAGGNGNGSIFLINKNNQRMEININAAGRVRVIR